MWFVREIYIYINIDVCKGNIHVCCVNRKDEHKQDEHIAMITVANECNDHECTYI